MYIFHYCSHLFSFQVPITLVLLFWANVWFMINFMGFVEVIFQTMCYCIIPYIRWTQPEREIPFKVFAITFQCYNFLEMIQRSMNNNIY